MEDPTTILFTLKKSSRMLKVVFLVLFSITSLLSNVDSNFSKDTTNSSLKAIIPVKKAPAFVGSLNTINPKTSILGLIDLFNENINLNNKKDISDPNLLNLRKKILDQIFVDLKSSNKNFLSFSERKDELHKISILREKILLNDSKGYSIAVTRDTVKKHISENKIILHEFVEKMQQLNKNFADESKFIELISSYNNDINSNLLTEPWLYEPSNSPIAKEAIQHNEILVNQINSYQTFFLALEENVSVFAPDKLFTTILKKNTYIEFVNNIPFVADHINPYSMYFIKTDLGRLVLAILLFSIIMTTRFVLVPIIVSILENYLKKEETDSKKKLKKEQLDEFLIKGIKGPLKIVLMIFSVSTFAEVIHTNQFDLESTLHSISVLYIIVTGWLLINLVSNAIETFSELWFIKYPNVRTEMIIFSSRIIYFFIVSFVFLASLHQFKVDITAFLGGLGILGFGVSLAFKDTFSNFFASFSIIMDQSFSQGDWIETKDVEGVVIDIRMRTTTLRSFENALITVPNTSLANSDITNWSRRKIGRRIKMELGVTYSSGMTNIVALKNDIFTMLESHPNIATEKIKSVDYIKSSRLLKKEDVTGIKKTLLVYVDSFGDSSINILVYAFSRSPNWEDWLKTKEDVMVKIDELFKNNNCEFAFPSQTIFLEK